MRWIIPALILLAAVSPASAQSWMVGTWFGYGQPHDKSAMYIDRVRADGSWRGEYRTCVKGKAEDQIQTGRWSMTGDTLVLRVEKVNDQAMPRTDRYRMEAHSPTAQKYVSLDWSYTYTPRRMADDFKMPPCDLVS